MDWRNRASDGWPPGIEPGAAGGTPRDEAPVSIPNFSARAALPRSQLAAVKPGNALARTSFSLIRLLPVGRWPPESQRLAKDLSMPVCWASFARLQFNRLHSNSSLPTKSSMSTDFGIARSLEPEHRVRNDERKAVLGLRVWVPRRSISLLRSLLIPLSSRKCSPT